MNRLFVLALVFSLNSFAAVSIIPSVGGAMTNMKIESATGATPTTGQFAPAGGIGLNFGLAKALEFEVGGYYAGRKHKATLSILGTALEVDQEYTAVLVPVFFRIRFSPFISLTAGGFTSFGMGNIKTTVLGTTIESDYDSAEAEKMNYGILGGLTFEIPVGKMTSLAFDFRYLHGIQNVSKTTGLTAKTSDIMGLLGLRFML